MQLLPAIALLLAALPGGLCLPADPLAAAAELAALRRRLPQRIAVGAPQFASELAGDEDSAASERAAGLGAAAARQLPANLSVFYSPIGGDPGCGFTVSLDIGGAHPYDLILDTGSSIFAASTSACPALAGSNDEGCNLPPKPISLLANETSTYAQNYGTTANPAGWTGNLTSRAVSAPLWSSSRAPLSVSPYTLVGITAATSFFDPRCPHSEGILGIGTASVCLASGECPLIPFPEPFFRGLNSASSAVPRGYALQLCGNGTDPSNSEYATMGGNFWFGGADSRFLAEPFQWAGILDGTRYDNGSGTIAVDLKAFQVDGETAAEVGWTRTGPVIADSGTSLLVMGSDLFSKVSAAMRNASFVEFDPRVSARSVEQFWSGMGYAIIVPCTYVTFGTSTLSLLVAGPESSPGDVSLPLDPTALILRRAVPCPSNPQGVLDCMQVQLAIALSGQRAGITILGAPAFQGRVVFFDFPGRRAGWAGSVGCRGGPTPSAQGIDIFPGALYREPSITTQPVPDAYPPATCGGQPATSTAVPTTARTTSETTTSRTSRTTTGVRTTTVFTIDTEVTVATSSASAATSAATSAVPTSTTSRPSAAERTFGGRGWAALAGLVALAIAV
ncbi:aspartic peptidase domain-containing protein [Hyaloraphidium curvatum]|nr:aspartic peptidase domain-containing protein [Hyaloraphidium curvatum]